MGLPTAAVVALAGFLRDRLVDVGDTLLAPPRAVARSFARDAAAVVEHSPEQRATVVVGAVAPFAPTAYARARLLRQMHAAGLLSRQETEQMLALPGVAGTDDVAARRAADRISRAG